MTSRSLSIGAFLAITLAGCAGHSTSTSSSSRTTSPPQGPAIPATTTPQTRNAKYKIVGRVFFYLQTSRPTRGPTIVDGSVAFRTNRRLPLKDGSPYARVEVNGGTGATPPVRFSSRSRHCYAQPIDGFPSPPPHVGGRAILTVSIANGAYRIRRSVRVLSAAQGRRLARREPSCGKPIIDAGS